MAQTILYYPNINIKDGQWLRNALLYWDNISSIVPYENYQDLSHELLFLQDLGIYEPIFPQNLFFSEYADDFCNAIIKRISRYENDECKKFSMVNVEKVRRHKQKIYAPALRTLIHYKKLPSELLDYFTDKKYIDDLNRDGWMEIDAKIAQIYMKTLAEYSIKSSDKDIVLGTDKVTNSREIYNCTGDHKIDNQCCRIDILKCLPQPSLDTSFEDILEFKLRRKDEFKAFREKIRELEENIYRSNSIDEIKHYEKKFVESWEIYYSDYTRALLDSRIRFVLGNLCAFIAIPSISNAIENVLTQHIGQEFFDSVQLGAGLLQMGISYIDYKNKINPNKGDGGFSYIINARREGMILA